MTDATDLVPTDQIQQRIFVLRGQKVMLDRDLAMLYGVETRVLNQAVRRNIVRFPNDFMFLLTREEIMRISQIVISSANLRFSKRVAAFTQEGVAMLSGVLNSPRAIHVNIAIMRAFVRMRDVLNTQRRFAAKLAELEQKLSTHDTAIREIVEAIQQLTALPQEPETEKPKIGFQVREAREPYGRRRRNGRYRTH